MNRPITSVIGRHVLLISGMVSLLLFQATAPGRAQVREARVVTTRVLAVFQAQSLPTDAAQRAQKAGGKITASLAEVGVLVVEPVSVDGATLLENLRRDNAILFADYDRVLNLIAPAAISADEDTSTFPQSHLPHPLPTFSPALLTDFFYTSSPQQWSVKRVGATGGGVPGGGQGAWDVTKGAGVKIAILDTGIDPVHPDVSGNLIFNRSLTFDLPALFTPNCEVPDSANPPFDLPVDQNGHGTWTSSLAAGAIGGGLMIGVAPQTQILNVKVLRNRPATPQELAAIGVPDTPFNRCQFRDASGLFSWIPEGILLANQQGADVISMSLAGFVPRNGAYWSSFDRVSNFVTSRGSLLLAVAGNFAMDLDTLGQLALLPAQSPNVIALIATTNPALFPPTPPARQPCSPGQDCLAFYSDFGSSLHGLAAPGGDLSAGGCAFSGSPCGATGFLRGACSSGVLGTSTPVPAGYPPTGPPPLGASWGCFSYAGAAQHAWYAQTIGTSGSTPIAAGVAALVKSANPSLSPAQIRTILQRTAQDIGKVGYDSLFNYGLVDATAAVQAAMK
jgi:lantibiotic leader peptide-processing serine protease